MVWLTVLTPLFNGIEYFKECYESIVKQTETDWLWIIGVNGHGDDSNPIYQMLKQIPDKRITVKNYLTKGKVNTLNEMMMDVTTPYIALCDCDDVWIPQKLEIQKILLENNRNIDVLGTSCQYIGELNHVLNLPEGKINLETMFKINPIVNSSVILKTQNAFWEDRFGLEDYDLWFRLILENNTICVINQPLIYHRIHKESAFNNSGVQDVNALLKYYREKVSDVTVVTAFYPMKSKFQPTQYIDWIKPFWSQVKCNTVFFTSEEYAPYIQSICSLSIKVITMDFSEIEAYKKFSKDFWLGEEEKDHETNHSADLYAIWYEKKEFVKKAIVMNLFLTNKFVWCDAGICRSEGWIPHIQLFPLSHKIPEDKFLILKITDFEKEEDLKFKNSVGGGILAGTKEKWFEFSEQYDSVLEEFVESSKFVGKDQTLIATMYKKNPSFFKLIDRQFDENMCWFTLLFFLSC